MREVTAINMLHHILSWQQAIACAFTASTSLPPFAIISSPSKERETENNVDSGIPECSLVNLKISGNVYYSGLQKSSL